MFTSTLFRACQAQKIAAEHYESGNQAKCYKAIWRRFILPEMGIGYRTFLDYLKMKVD